MTLFLNTTTKAATPTMDKAMEDVVAEEFPDPRSWTLLPSPLKGALQKSVAQVQRM